MLCFYENHWIWRIDVLLTLSMCCLLDGWPEKTAFIGSRVGIIGVFRKFYKLNSDGRRRRCHLRLHVRNRHYLEFSFFYLGGENGIVIRPTERRLRWAVEWRWNHCRACRRLWGDRRTIFGRFSLHVLFSVDERSEFIFGPAPCWASGFSTACWGGGGVWTQPMISALGRRREKRKAAVFESSRKIISKSFRSIFVSGQNWDHHGSKFKNFQKVFLR